MACERAGLKHRGWAVHGDIDVVPANTPCVWEPEGPDTALILAIHPDLLARAAKAVSYTHLDVYKRQATARAVERLSKKILPVG